MRELAGWACAAAAVMSLIALGDWPYGYYMLLRWVVCGAACLGCWWLWFRGWKPAVVPLVLLAILFNPIERFHMDKETWRVFNVVAAAALGALALAALRPQIIADVRCFFYGHEDPTP